MARPLGPDVLGLAVLGDEVEDVCGQEEPVDGVTDEAVPVTRGVGGLADHAQKTSVMVGNKT